MASIPQISILVPTRNRSHLLAGLIDSVIAQTYKNWELVVVDNGSTDGTPSLLKEWSAKDPRVRFLRFERNLDFYDGLVEAYKVSRGALFSYLGDDDRLLPGTLALQAAEFARNPSLGLVTGNALAGLAPPGRPLHAESRSIPSDRTITTAEFTDGHFRFTIHSTLFSRKAVEVAGGLLKEWANYQDIDLVYRVATRFPVVYLQKPLSFARENPEGWSANRDKREMFFDAGRRYWQEVEKGAADDATRQAAKRYLVQHELNCCYYYSDLKTWDFERFREHVAAIFKESDPKRAQAYYFLLLSRLPERLVRAAKTLKSRARA